MSVLRLFSALVALLGFCCAFGGIEQISKKRNLQPNLAKPYL
tara:strand:+ start:375 stop:500 length:126 start_codon:yes stop_codon:yes gene_type:complete